MARGFESKSVESQQADRRAPEQRPPHSAEELERARKRESLEMSRRGIVAELERSHSSVHRAALEHALRHFDDQLSKLD